VYVDRIHQEISIKKKFFHSKKIEKNIWKRPTINVTLSASAIAFLVWTLPREMNDLIQSNSQEKLLHEKTSFFSAILLSLPYLNDAASIWALLHLPISSFPLSIRNLSYNLSHENIQQTLVNIGQQNVTSIVNYHTTYTVACSIFSLPFAFDYLEDVGNIFPNIVFSYVTCLLV